MSLQGVIYTVAATVFVLVEIRHQLWMFQQNSYRADRYFRWRRTQSPLEPRAIFAASLLLLSLFATEGAAKSVLWYVSVAGMALLIRLELRKKHKKFLVFTPRAIRIYATSLLLAFVVILLLISPWNTVPVMMIPVIMSFILVPAANLILNPVEGFIVRCYYNDARRILRSMPHLTVIGITGSYGKTSTKHYLHRILSEKYSVLMTPGNFNTALGVVRTIREELKPYHKVFIVEMGARERGDIAEICGLVHPAIGVLTYVGEQHLETFGSVDNIRRTKFELIDALPSDGLAVLNYDSEHIAGRPVTNVSDIRTYAVGNPGAMYNVRDIEYSAAGASFVLEGPEGEQRLETRLAGAANLSNLAAACIVAEKLGMGGDILRGAAARVSQVEHRLCIRHGAGGVNIIDDAYNSNPLGAAMALDVLGGFKGGRRIVVTPGFVELGDRQAYHCEALGRKIASSADYAVVVNRINREAIVRGLKEGGFGDDKIYIADTFGDASAHLAQILRAGDTVLYENDLPDQFK